MLQKTDVDIFAPLTFPAITTTAQALMAGLSRWHPHVVGNLFGIPRSLSFPTGPVWGAISCVICAQGTRRESQTSCSRHELPRWNWHLHTEANSLRGADCLRQCRLS
jgi:hypothetical protein